MWYFVSPQLVFGQGALAALSELHARRALIVTDTGLVSLGLVDKVRVHLVTAGMEVRVFDGVEPDPSLATVSAGAVVAREFAPDLIVGVGGGSTMDAAKAIWVLYERPDLSPEEINPVTELGLRKKARLVTIPTTSGTGAEVTWAIVLTDPSDQRKLGLGNRENVADLAIVDPDMSIGMPPQLTADTGMDALTHAVEGYTCTWHSDMTDGICIHAARLILRYLPRAYADGGDWEARERMANAAALAGLGFGNALASMAHALGHALGGIFHVPHGRAVGLFLPYTLDFVSGEAPERFAELADALGLSVGGDARSSARSLASGIRSFAWGLGLPGSIAELSIPRAAYEAHLDRLMDNAFNDSTMMTAARCPSYDELRQLLLCAYDGTEIDF